MQKLIVLSLGLVLIAAACNKTENNTTPPPAPAPAATPNPTTPVTPPPASGPVEIRMTDAGFEPSAVTIKKGTAVKFINSDDTNRWPASAPHPSHTDYPEFDPKQAVAAGSSWTFTFDRTGTWRFHDHLLPTKFGSVTVTE